MRNVRFLITLACAVIILFVALSMSATAVEETPPLGGDWIVVGTKEFTGKTGYVGGNVMVSSSSQFTIEDSTLIINNSFVVESYATLVIKNSTIKFDSTIDLLSRFEILGHAIVTITDNDMDRLTTADASVIMSNTSSNYDWLVMLNSTFTMRNSFVYDCGEYTPGPFVDDGLIIQTNNALIEGTSISDGYYGIIAEGIDILVLDNVTVSDCAIGLRMMGNRDSQIKTCRFLNNSIYGVQLIGFLGNVRFESSVFAGNEQANLHMYFSSGYADELVNCTFGPGGQVGVYLEEVSDWDIRANSIIGCQIGIDILGGELTLVNNKVSDCAQGVNVGGDGVIRLDDLGLTNTSIDVDTQPRVNITAIGSVRWEDVTGFLACVIETEMSGRIELENCQLSFQNRQGVPTGLRATSRGTLIIYNSTIDSPVSGEWIAHMNDGSRVEFMWTTFLDLGTLKTGPRELGLFIGGSGRLEEVEIRDSIVGLVIGRANANFVNITIRDCETGIMADGDLGRGGADIRGLLIERCDATVVARSDGSLSVSDGIFHLYSGTGFNLSKSSITLRDSWVSAPAPGELTAVLKDISVLNLVNSVSSQDFSIGSNHNSVNIYWYLNLTLRYLSDGSPLSDAKVTIDELSGKTVQTGLDAGPAGYLEKIELREKSLTPDEVITTPHTVTVTSVGLEDSFTVLMDGSMDLTFDMDNYPPVLTILLPEDGSMHNVPTITFTGEAWDAVITETEGLRSMAYRVDGGNWTPIEIPAVKAWTFDVILDNGFHVVEVEVYDNIGNHNTDSVNVEMDTSPPDLIVLTPVEGLFTDQASLLVTGLSDPGAEVTINGVVVDVSVDGTFNHTLELEEGKNVIVTIATDDVGNSRTETRNVTLDTSLPEVILDQEGPWITNEPMYVLSGSKEVNASIYINGFLVEYFDSDHFTTTLDLEEGLNPVLIFSVDLAGNNWTQNLIIELDSTPPTLQVARLPEYTNDDMVTVQGSVNDPDAIVTVNGVEVTMSGLTFAYQITLAEGENTITVEARDMLGNEAEQDIQVVTLDIIPPVLSIDTPKYIKTIQDEQNLSGNSEPGLPVVVVVLFGGYTKSYNVIADDDGSFFVLVALPQVGNHTVTVTVDDLAGNRATEELYFERVRPEVPPPVKPEGPSWFEENWTYLILIAAIIASLAVWMLTLSATKQKKEAMRTRARATREAAAKAEAEEEWEDEEETDADLQGDDEDADEGLWEEEEDSDEGPREDKE